MVAQKVKVQMFLKFGLPIGNRENEARVDDGTVTARRIQRE